MLLTGRRIAVTDACSARLIFSVTGEVCLFSLSLLDVLRWLCLSVQLVVFKIRFLFVFLFIRNITN